MITIEQYVGVWANAPDWTPERQANAAKLLEACARLQATMEADGVIFPVNPVTRSEITGYQSGGFRPQHCPQGAPGSGHKDGQAVDRYDPKGEIDDWIMLHQDELKAEDLYLEHPIKTPGWSHWGIRLRATDPPKSGRHVYFP